MLWEKEFYLFQWRRWSYRGTSWLYMSLLLQGGELILSFWDHLQLLGGSSLVWLLTWNYFIIAVLKQEEITLSFLLIEFEYFQKYFNICKYIIMLSESRFFFFFLHIYKLTFFLHIYHYVTSLTLIFFIMCA